MTPRALLLFPALVLACFSSTFANAGTCYIDDPGSLNARSSPIQIGGGAVDDFGGTDACHGPSNGPHEVHGSSCVLQALINSTSRSGGTTCLTIGKGVTVEMNGHTIDCPNSDAPCGKAIETTSSLGSGTTINLKDGNITGCWDTAISNTTTVNTSVSGFIIDMTGGANCTGNGNHGITSKFQSISRTVVSNCDNEGIKVGSGGTVSDSIVHDCGVGINYEASDIDHCLLIANDMSLQNTNLTLDLKDTTLRDSPCHFGHASGCFGFIPTHVDFLGVNFIDDVIY